MSMFMIFSWNVHMVTATTLIFLMVLIPGFSSSFVLGFPLPSYSSPSPLYPPPISSSLWKPSTSSTSTTTTTTSSTIPLSMNRGQEQIILDPTLTDERLTSLFAWISCAFRGDTQYDNLMLGIVAIFGTNLDPASQPIIMAEQALSQLPGLTYHNDNNDDDNDDDKEEDGGSDYTITNDEICVGAPISKYQREQASLGAMGAAQWTGQWKTRPHALLEIRNTPHALNLTSIDDYVKGLPRGCRRTLKKANQLIESQNITVVTKQIQGGSPAPHSTLAHFKCVVEHEVRLLATLSKSNSNENDTQEDIIDVEYFFNALSEAVSRYVGTTRMTGTIQEYRNTQTHQIIAFAHEVRKGKTMRGQWFYATNEASRNYVWFHSVQDLVRRAIDCDDIEVVDLGPSGSDAFSDLKARYGFLSVEDWPSVADYQGPFWYGDDDIDDDDDDERNMLDNLLKLFE